jgi:hypothetical protein
MILVWCWASKKVRGAGSVAYGEFVSSCFALQTEKLQVLLQQQEKEASFISGEKHCIRISVVFRLYLVKNIQILFVSQSTTKLCN